MGSLKRVTKLKTGGGTGIAALEKESRGKKWPNPGETNESTTPIADVAPSVLGRQLSLAKCIMILQGKIGGKKQSSKKSPLPRAGQNLGGKKLITVKTTTERGHPRESEGGRGTRGRPTRPTN